MTREPFTARAQRWLRLTGVALMIAMTAVMGVALVLAGTKHDPHVHHTIPDWASAALGCAMIAAAAWTALVEWGKWANEKLARVEALRIDAIVAEFAAQLAGVEPFDLTGR